MKSIVVVTYFSDVFIFAPDFVFKAICFIFIFDLYFVVAFVISSVFVFSCSNFSDLVCWSLLLSWVDDATRLLLNHQPAVKYNYKYKYEHCYHLYLHHYLCLSPNLYLYISVLYLQSAGCQSAPKPHNIELDTLSTVHWGNKQTLALAVIYHCNHGHKASINRLTFSNLELTQDHVL